MKICFNMSGVGLANNGGSRTLIRCAETLTNLGYDAFFWSGKSRYTWHDAKIKLVSSKTPPKCDVLIATGANSYESTASFSGLRAAYVRGLELWKAKESRLLELFRKMDVVFVNSEWQKCYLEGHNIASILQYPGIDDWFFVKNPDELPNRVGIGALCNTRHKTKKSKDIDALINSYGLPIHQLNKDIKRPTREQLNNWYNRLGIWFSPSELEGLHNPPYEAILAGCVVVATNAVRGGTSDYVIHDKTGLVYQAGNLTEAATYINRLVRDTSYRLRLWKNANDLVRTKFGTRDVRMAEFAQRLKEQL